MTKIQICGPNGRNLFFFFELSRKIVKRLSKNGPVTGFWVQHAAFCINVQGSNRILSYPGSKRPLFLFSFGEIGPEAPNQGGALSRES